MPRWPPSLTHASPESPPWPARPPNPRPRPATIGELRDAGWRPRTVKEEMRANLVGRLAAGRPVFEGHRRLRGERPPGDRERAPRRPGHRVPRRARPGQDPDGAPARQPARRVAAGRPRRRAQRRPVRADQRRGTRDRRGGRRRHPDRLDPARPPLRGEARDARHHDRRPHRRGRPDPGRRGPLPVRRADPPLRPDPARQPRHLRASTSCPTSRSGSRSACSTSSRSATSRSAASRSGCRSTCSSSRRPTRRTTRSRGRIITPLKDRLGSQIRTHYPRSLEHEVAIVRQEKQASRPDDGDPARRRARRSWRSSSPS